MGNYRPEHWIAWHVFFFLQSRNVPLFCNFLAATVHNLEMFHGDNRTIRYALSLCANVASSLDSISGSSSEETLLINAKEALTDFLDAWVESSVPVLTPVLFEHYDTLDPVTEVQVEVEESRREDDSNEELVPIALEAYSTLISLCKLLRHSDNLKLLKVVAKCARARDIQISLAGMRACVEISSYIDAAMKEDVRDSIEGLIYRCWRLLHPSLSTAGLEAAETWLLFEAHYPSLSSAVVADGIVSEKKIRRARNLERFSCLWQLVTEHRLSRRTSNYSQFLVLDALKDADRTHAVIANDWLVDALLTDPASVVDEPLRLLLGPDSMYTIGHVF
eukprot:Plantae.Rhodophyta-Purpureofilum_apyrenoidigerum.ctg33474.p1 GENE.Plantae.Rhodophyta-Purpureofilum_apyrenoidigerum.ctg33474~~Plantae.Rhodophyta-Purpureofilum_apyrenoidigerum.ctg33474.p1  ORF type:complete len:334 (-),score=41.58 Plantae.Rhodophyta-Purpureofilum_apyrenoidigerum.ctg33474:64-1065(-)